MMGINSKEYNALINTKEKWNSKHKDTVLEYNIQQYNDFTTLLVNKIKKKKKRKKKSKFYYHIMWILNEMIKA